MISSESEFLYRRAVIFLCGKVFAISDFCSMEKEMSVFLCNQYEPANITTKSIARGIRNFMLNPASLSVWKLSTRFFDFSIALSSIMMSDGSTVNIATRLQSTPFARTMPMSAPIFSFMNKRASSPTMVVNALLTIDDDALLSAFDIASILSFPDSFSCR